VNNTVTARDMEFIQIQAQGILDSTNLPISFYIGEQKYRGIPAAFHPHCEVAEVSETVKDYTFIGTSPEMGLEIKTVVTEYTDYPVYDIVTYFTAIGENKTPMLRNIKGFDGIFHGEKAILYRNSGDFCSENGYEQTAEPYTHEMWTHIAPQGGRCSDQAFPYFKLQFAGHGVNLAVGWPGQWGADFGVVEKGVCFSAGQELTNLYLNPGETIRTPKVTIMAYDGDYERGVNLWRRWYCKYVLPKPNGEPIKPQFVGAESCSSIEFLESTEENQIASVQRYASYGMPYTLWWIDAGWYECSVDDPEVKLGRRWQQTGTWMPDAKRFPNGMMPLSKKLAEHHMNLLVWFEPERVRAGTELHREHPEWLLHVENVNDGQCGYALNYMLNLGIKECADWLINRVDSLIKENGIRVYRQDYNFPPLRYWRENESFDRQGMTENLYIQGYLRYWDTLLERNPGLWIDSCASGGRRNDLETLRRSVPLHPTDYGYGYQHIGQAFARTLNEWIPYYRIAPLDWSQEDGTYPPASKVVSRQPDYFTYMAALCPCLTTSGITGTKEEQMVGRIWKRASEIMVQCDYYPLSQTSKKPNQFCVNQFYRPEEGKGYVQAIRHTQCEQECFHAQLRDIEDDKTYRFDDMRTGQEIVISGKQLNEVGFSIFLKKRGAAIWFYEVVKEGV